MSLKNVENADKSNAFIDYTAIDDETIEYVKQQCLNAGFKNVYACIASSTIAVHCGEGTLGIMYMEKIKTSLFQFNNFSTYRYFDQKSRNIFFIANISYTKFLNLGGIMDKNNGIYDMIAERTNGDVYIGVVGPVRCGKSTFITKFMQSFVLPNIQNVNDRIRATDELPQASEGKTVMTTQPKFVPNEAIKLKLGKVALNLRMIDCVGFMVDGAMGHFEDDKPRLVQTPWSDEKIPFTQAAALGTQKVINEHSTVAVVMTTDGSFTNIDRENYALTEKKVIDQVKASQKPFVIVLNTSKPNAEATKKLVAKLQENYQAPVMALDVVNLDSADIDSLMAELLMQFPIEAINIKLPNWLRALPYEHPIINEIIGTVKEKNR